MNGRIPLLARQAIQPLIELALREDGASQDITSSAIVPREARIRARVLAKSPGVLAGGPVAVWTFHAVDASLRCLLRRREGSRLATGQTILTVEGRAQPLFAAERTALNFLGHLSGIATLTRQFVQRVQPFPAAILDTRKTLPGLRLLEKYAVRVGGGRSHRMGLAEAVLIKTNHLRAVRRGTPGSGRSDAGAVIREALQEAGRRRPKRFVEVEVSSLEEFEAALDAGPEAILLDNWFPRTIRQAVCLRDAASRMPDAARPLLEVSGGVTLANVRAIARTGVDRISIGCLTHSAPSLDVSLEVLGPG